MRMCCGCNKRFEQHTLIRLKASTETQALKPVEHSASGRSAWVCCNIHCINKIVKAPKRLNRSLRTSVNLEQWNSVLKDWLHQQILSYVQTMIRDGITFAGRNKKSSTNNQAENVIRLSEIIQEVRLQDKTNQINREGSKKIGSHHLLKKTIRYNILLNELKLD